MQWLVYADFILITCLLLFISWQDILLRIISNDSLIVLLCLVVLFVAMQQRFPNIIAALVVIAVFFPLFIFNIIGGGDIKLMSVLSMAFSWQQNADFFFITALLGGVIGVIGFLFYCQIVREHGIPYGVAISLAFIFFNVVLLN
ncbi:hypothetical protein BTJ39_03170 [Izhakiella australiensis]|uniref:Prepilin type IV endopeptidase peptidase domain-containing protein n=2 Tax=Izhakiella australiensis TaxID=1926881 RepID=A0A1S8YSU3_9GAMM|nr:hypothetical protein BTJ39_03170 [Izhakiella australiensis]